jgi:diacylglycerol kinase (ATP)
LPAPAQIILNPNSASGRGARILPKLLRRLEAAGLEHDLQVSEAPGHARQLASRLSGTGTSRLLVVGGDGTLHEVVNGLFDRGGAMPAVAVVPVGTGNDFFRMVDSPGDLAGALETFLTGTPRSFDVGRLHWAGGSEHFVNLAGIGLDVEVLRRRARFSRLPGLAQYLCSIGSALTGFTPPNVRVEFESSSGGTHTLSGRTLLTAVTIGPSVAGGIRLSPDASPDDGALDLFMVEGLGVLSVVRYLPKVLRGTHGSIRNIHLERIRKLRLESADDEDLHFELDGELMPATTPWIEIEIVPACLPILQRVRPPRGEGVQAGGKA